MFEGFGDTDSVGLAPAEDAIILRQSSVGSMDLCPARQGYLLSGKATQMPSEAMTFGTMIHSFAEWRLEGNHDVVTTKHLEEWWDETIDSDSDGQFTLQDLLTPTALADKLHEAVQACHEWDTTVFPELGLSQDVLIEELLLVPMGVTPSGREMWLRGTADVVDLGNAHILDWKTAGRGWDPSKAMSTHQAQAYSFLVEGATGKLILDFTYWVWNRKSWTWEQHVTERTPSQVDAWIKHAWQRGLQIEAQAFPFTPWDSTFGKFKRGWWCSAKYCAAWDVCEGKSLPDDVWEEQPIEISAGWS